MLNKFITSTLLICVVIFLISLYALIVQTFDVKSENLATIISGILGMLGGIIGAFGAYFAARYQIKKQKEEFEEREKINARPTIACFEFKGPTRLANVNMHENARLLATKFYEDNKHLPYFSFYELKVLGKTSSIFDCKLKVTMDNVHGENSIIEAYLGIMENNVEVFIPLPFIYLQRENEYLSYTHMVELEYETSNGEKIRYVYNSTEGYERYFIIENNQEILLKDIELFGSEWLLPGRIK
ncbi:hypothetical protein [Lysinibacillus endophyticus]|uniref:hypothetical protein n=1 Tax=Ureibacillus endophyticus TaxID=1978490 RepID=UPI00209EB648|nr:hypothetical protein [Lysinibacillus endophyticus]MCP1144866.1 hypothetical protein [Lysinibacillus endophyticus]